MKTALVTQIRCKGPELQIGREYEPIGGGGGGGVGGGASDVVPSSRYIK